MEGKIVRAVPGNGGYSYVAILLSPGRVYNELGLTYTQCHDFAKAATCFELALPLSRGATRDKKQEAVILQVDKLSLLTTQRIFIFLTKRRSNSSL